MDENMILASVYIGFLRLKIHRGYFQSEFLVAIQNLDNVSRSEIIEGLTGILIYHLWRKQRAAIGRSNKETHHTGFRCENHRVQRAAHSPA